LETSGILRQVDNWLKLADQHLPFLRCETKGPRSEQREKQGRGSQQKQEKQRDKREPRTLPY